MVDNLNNMLTNESSYVNAKQFYKNNSSISDKYIMKCFYMCVFSCGSITRCQVINSDLSSNSFESMVFEDCILNSIDLTKSEFDSCLFKNVTFIDCLLRKTEFTDTTFIDCTFQNSSFVNIFLTSSELLSSSLDTVNFSNANITDLKTSDLKISNLVLRSPVYIWDKDWNWMLNDGPRNCTIIDDINNFKKFLNNV